MTKIIGIDLDEVLAELIDYVLDYHDYNLNGKILKKEDIKDYYIYRLDSINITKEEAINWFRKAMEADKNNFSIKPINGAYEILKKYKDKGYNFKIVTARNGDLFGDYTKKWVEKHYFGIFDDIIFANYFSTEERSKADLCKEHGICYMVEDNIDYALELAKNGIKTFLLEKPWNKEITPKHENLIKVKDWNEINFE